MVHTLFLSNKEAQQLIESGSVKIDDVAIYENCLLPEHAEIKVNDKLVRTKTELIYLAFHKPVGFESTLNPTVENNLSSFFTAFQNLAIAGRLDKQSEGLLLLSNDGKWVESICNPDAEKEKEYEVTLNKIPEGSFFTIFEQGMRIGGYMTKPCRCELLEASTIRVVLTEGKNRQIRRMCHTLGYAVLRLKRTRTDHYKLQDLQPGEYNVIKFNN